MKQILIAIEAQQTERLIREAALDLPDIDGRTGLTAKQTLAKINTDIIALRSQLQ